MGGQADDDIGHESHFRETSSTRVLVGDLAGRDVVRLGVGAAWQRDHVTGFGLVMEGTVGFDLDYYNVGDDRLVQDSLRSTCTPKPTCVTR